MKRNRTILVMLVLMAFYFAAMPLCVDAIMPTALQADRQAVLIVQFGDGSYITRCIPFHEESISGLDLLTRSGLRLVTWGQAVCRIEDEGCDYPVEPCFCQCQRAPCLYWSYWHWWDDRWVYSVVGAADYQVHNGDVEAWVWGNGNPPRVVPSEQICPPSTNATLSTPVSEMLTPVAPLPSDMPSRSPMHTEQQGMTVEQLAALAVVVSLLIGGAWMLSKRHGGQ